MNGQDRVKLSMRARKQLFAWQYLGTQAMRTLHPIVVFLIPFLGVGGCRQDAGGGGNAGDAGRTPSAVVEPDVAITLGNAFEATRAGVRGAFDLMRLVYIGASFMVKPQPEPPTDPGAGGGGASPAVLSSEFVGPQGGAATFSWDDVDGGGAYTSSDVFTIRFDDYGDSDMMLNGIMEVVGDVQGLMPGTGAWIFEGSVRTLGLEVTLGAQEIPLEFELPFYFESRLIVQLFELELTEDFTFGEFEIQAGATYLRYATEDEVRYSSNGAVFSPVLDGIVRFSMPQFITGVSLFPNPFIGAFFIEGAGDSVIEAEPVCLIPLPIFCTSLDLRVDEDGDETIEGTVSATWAELLPQ
ncbi:MAG: hypothetical protein AB8H80_02280 [Planctomycetota bacterium]